MNAIELKQVKKRYGDFALNDVNICLPQGCVLGLIGENGAGKSTLIRMMCGMCKPDGGEVVVLGERAGRSAAFTRVKQDIGVVLDEACLPDELTAPQIAQCMRGIYTHWDDEVFGGFMRRFALPEDKAVRHYSRGMKMKLAIAAAMSHHAKLLLLDEATSGLDPVVRDDILDVFNEFTRQEDHSVLISPCMAFLVSAMPCFSLSTSMTSKPTLCLVLAYSLPGFPSPTTMSIYASVSQNSLCGNALERHSR